MRTMLKQKEKSKEQNDKSKFKKEFTARLIAFTVSVLRFARVVREEGTLWPLTDQLTDSAGSIGANVVEAQTGSSRKDYTRFFEIALKSANETKYWLLVARIYDTRFAYEANRLLSEAEELGKVIGSSVLTLKGHK